MSVSVTISGEIIESRNYLSNYFVTLNSDQTIYANKTFNNLNATTINVSTINVPQINSSSLDISTNNLTLNGYSIKTLSTIFGSEDISSNLSNGTIYFGKTFDLEPCVTISQYSSSRIVPICVTNITTEGFNWAAGSSNVGKILWSAGIKF
jgi:hypothetical protein